MVDRHGCDCSECWSFSQGDCSTADAVMEIQRFAKVFHDWAQASQDTWYSCLDTTEQHSLESLPVQREVKPLLKLFSSPALHRVAQTMLP